nr:patatin-like phospholipase family protein [Flavobacterium sp.]
MQELPLVVLQSPQKIVFSQKRIFTSIWGLWSNSISKFNIKIQYLQVPSSSLVTGRTFSFASSFSTLASCFLPLFLLFSLPSSSQEIKKPKIGLVLSGGGAKGFAHIGVLKEIEKAGIKIDYIGGTSMGAIIGGLYASGYSATQLDSIFEDTDFDALIQDFVPRNNRTFYEKRNDEMYAISLPFQNFKISVPKGLSKGLYNYNLLSKLTHNVRHVEDFSKLKIPFLCIATNVETGQKKVFKSGSLPQVLSASGAFPSLFSPIEIDGSFYIDGGITDNYPVEEVRKMGADIIIGVDVQDDLKKVDDIKGATGVLAQISNYQMLQNMKGKKEKTDVYIKPNIENFSVMSFGQGTEIIKKGVEAAQLVKNQLDALGTKYQMKKIHLKKDDSLYIKKIGINDLKNYTRSYVIGKLRFNEGSKISYDDLNSGINNLNSTQNFSSISYKLLKEGSSDVIMVNAEENQVKTYLKFGLHYDDLFKSAALVNFTHKNLIFTNDIASLDIILGDNFRYNFDYYRDNGFHWSFGLKSKLTKFKKASQTDFNTGQILNSLNLESLNIDYLDFTNQAYIQTVFVQKFLIGAGIENKYLKIASNSLQNNASFIDNSNYSSIFGFLKYDSFSNKYFPKKGWYIFGDTQTFLTSTDYKGDFEKFTILKADAAIVKTFFKKFAVKLQAEGGFTLGKNPNHIFDFALGGYGFSAINNFKPFYGYDFLGISGDTYVKSSLSIDYEFIKKNHINITSNYANIGNKIFDDNTWISRPKYSGYAVGYGLETLIGPIEVKQSWSPEAKSNFTWFSIGFWF